MILFHTSNKAGTGQMFVAETEEEVRRLAVICGHVKKPEALKIGRSRPILEVNCPGWACIEHSGGLNETKYLLVIDENRSQHRYTYSKVFASIPITDREAGTGLQEAKIISVDDTDVDIEAECPYCDNTISVCMGIKEIGRSFVYCPECDSAVDVMNPFASIAIKIGRYS